jgi:hypothetical protein
VWQPGNSRCCLLNLLVIEAELATAVECAQDLLFVVHLLESMDLGYCVSATHNSKTCTHQATGHQEEATQINNMGKGQAGNPNV